MSDNIRTPTVILTAVNFQKWLPAIEDLLGIYGLTGYVTGDKRILRAADPNSPTADEEDRLDRYNVGLSKASALISMSVDDSQKPHIAPFRGDPKKMMEALKGVHMQQKAGNRFNALFDLLSIQKLAEETLSSLIGHVNSAIQLVRNLTPITVATDSFLGGTKPYDLNDLYNDLEAMSLIRSLPPEYETLTRQLLIGGHLSVEEIRTAFHAEESQQRALESAAAAVGGVYQRPMPQLRCTWCTQLNHLEKDCRRKEDDRQRTQEWVRSQESGGKKGKPQAGNAVQEFATKEPLHT
ncbi:hypothetical protein L218DRAFT_965630 [Marasmius fiardii PR-910]|nr:hypothetical protein L218DRAFT_965630 [Marasmius fiardii PR-910]